MPGGKKKRVRKKKNKQPADHDKLFEAAAQGNCVAIEEVLASGTTDVNTMIECCAEGGGVARSSALNAAVFRAREEAVALLLKKGADPNLANEIGGTPLMEAARHTSPRPPTLGIISQFSCHPLCLRARKVPPSRRGYQ